MLKKSKPKAFTITTNPEMVKNFRSIMKKMESHMLLQEPFLEKKVMDQKNTFN